MQTAQQIGKVLNLEHSLHDALVERMNWNENTITKQEFFAEWTKATNDRNYTPKLGDSSLQTGKRMHDLISQKEHHNQHVVFVTHGGAIVDYLRSLFGDKKLEGLKKQYNEGFDYTMLNCAINKITLGKEPTLELLNFTRHLSEISE